MRITIQIVAISLALLIGMVIIRLIGLSPALALKALFLGSLGSVNAISETLVKMTPLILTGLSYAFAYRAGLINIGAEGQLYMGGFLATYVGVAFSGLPMMLHLPFALLAGFLCGGLWGLLVGWLKVKFGANEIITTVMLNYVAIYLISYLVNGPMKAPPGNFPQSEPVAASALLPRILPGARLHWGLLVAILAVIVYFIVMWRMKFGYEVRVVGRNMIAARYAGMNPERVMLAIMFIAGGMGGLAGAIEILGVQEKLIQGFSPGYGFDGIAAALVGMNTPGGIVFGALLFGILRSGGNVMQMIAKVPVSVIYIMQGLVIIFVIAGQMIRFDGLKRYILGRRKSYKKWSVKME
ncbi:ABC transporter permease [bacterium]|nr:ABC transporter permease [bacterium]